MGRNAHKKFYSKTYDHSYELVVKKSQKKIKIYIMHYIGVFGVKPWNSPKKIKVSIDGSPTKSQKTMGTLIFLVNSAALHQFNFWEKLNFRLILPIWTF